MTADRAADAPEAAMSMFMRCLLATGVNGLLMRSQA